MSIKNIIMFVKRVVNVIKSYQMCRLKDYISYNKINYTERIRSINLEWLALADLCTIDYRFRLYYKPVLNGI